ncbi:MAG TPA: hypothetical protein VGN17_15860 [Bryobacteraceae bacterium]|jgi:hypothetical protein
MPKPWNNLHRWLSETHSGKFELRRHFFLQFFESEFTSSPGQAKVVAGGALGVLLSLTLVCVPAYYHKYRMLDLLPTDEPLQLALLADLLFVLASAAVASGIFTTLQWPALFPGLRDYLALAALPARARDVFIAKLSALLAFTLLAIVVVTILPSILLPLVVYGRYEEHIARQVPAIFISASLASLFVFFSLVSLQGVLLNLMPPRAFARVSLTIQAILLAILLCALPLVLATPELAPRMNLRPAWTTSVPLLWFLGLDQVIAGNTEPLAILLAGRSLIGVAASATLAVLTYLWSYRKHRVRILESPQIENAHARRWPELLTARLLPNLRALGVFGFTAKSLARSRQHRLILTGFAGVALGVIAQGIVSLALHSRFSTHGREFREAVGSVPLALSFCALLGLRYLFRLPIELRANWLFRIHEPGHAAGLLAGVEAFLFYFGVLPTAVLTLPLELRLFGAASGAAASVLYLLVSLIWMQALLFSFEKIPFTSSYMPGQQPLIQSVVHYTTLAILYIGLTGSIILWAAETPARSIGLILVLAAALWKARRARLDAQRIERMQFAETLDPAVLQLKLAGD